MNYAEIEDLIITLNIDDICSDSTWKNFKIYNINVVGGKCLRQPETLLMGGIITNLFNIYWHSKKKVVENQIGPFDGADTTAVER